MNTAPERAVRRVSGCAETYGFVPTRRNLVQIGIRCKRHESFTHQSRPRSLCACSKSFKGLRSRRDCMVLDVAVTRLKHRGPVLQEGRIHLMKSANF